MDPLPSRDVFRVHFDVPGVDPEMIALTVESNRHGVASAAHLSDTAELARRESRGGFERVELTA
jgi:HSP20 family molecular chaperone IbpA